MNIGEDTHYNIRNPDTTIYVVNADTRKGACRNMILKGDVFFSIEVQQQLLKVNSVYEVHAVLCLCIKTPSDHEALLGTCLLKTLSTDPVMIKGKVDKAHYYKKYDFLVSYVNDQIRYLINDRKKILDVHDLRNGIKKKVN